MRIVLFYSGVGSCDYFTDMIDLELKKLGHETFILEFGKNDAEFMFFAEKRIDLAISINGFGIGEEKYMDLWETMEIMAVNILVDHPLRFHDAMLKHPRHYVQFCCDSNHVDYVKKYFSNEVPQVFFLPHAGSVPEVIADATELNRVDRKKTIAEYGQNEKDIDILFSGNYYDPDRYYGDIDRLFEPGTVMNRFYKELFAYMRDNPQEATEQALSSFLYLNNIFPDKEKMLEYMRAVEPVDCMVRQYFRQKVVSTLVGAGFNVCVLGSGWKEHPDSAKPNLNILSDEVPFAETFSYMHRAKINLNVMPFFKAGSNDRIFNAYLHGSLPLTDPSEYLLEKYEAFINVRDAGTGELPIYYLDRLSELPAITELLLKNDDLRNILYIRGFEKTRYSVTWKELVAEVLEKAQMYR